MKIIKLEQRTPAWHDWRKGKDLPDKKPRITATAAAVLSGASPYSTPYRLWLELTNRAAPKPPNPAMLRGAAREDEALNLFNKKLGLLCAPACIEHDDHPWVAASLDGLDPLDGVLAEIKWPGADDHELARQNKVPPKYAPQLAWQWLAGGDEIRRQFYVSAYELEDKSVDLAVVEVQRNVMEERKLFVLCEDFRRRCLIGDESPTGPAWDQAAVEWLKAKRAAEIAVKELDVAKARLEALLGSDASREGAGVLVTRVAGRETTNWKQIASTVATVSGQSTLFEELVQELTKRGEPSLRISESTATMPAQSADGGTTVEPSPMPEQELQEASQAVW